MSGIMMRWVGVVVMMFLSAVVGGCLVWLMLPYDRIRLPGSLVIVGGRELDITYSDFVTIMLGVTAVILAAVAIGIGIVAAFTFSSLKRAAVKAADKAVEAGMKKLNRESATAFNDLKDQLANFALGYGPLADTATNAPDDQQQEDR